MLWPDRLSLAVVDGRCDNARSDAFPGREDVTDGARLDALDDVCCSADPTRLSDGVDNDELWDLDDAKLLPAPLREDAMLPDVLGRSFSCFMIVLCSLRSRRFVRLIALSLLTF